MESIAVPPDALLRPFARTDVSELHAVITENRQHLDQWLRWSSALQALPAVDAFVAQFQDKLARGDGFHLGLWLGGELAGGIVCWHIHRQNRNAEVGYWLGTRYVGRGLATRAAHAVLAHLFTQEGLHRVEMQCAVENRASRAIPEGLGFQLEGIRRDSHWITWRFQDHAVYGLLAPEWRQLTTA